MQFVNRKLNIEDAIDKTDPVPLYIQLTNTLKNMISGGYLKYGEKLPSEHEFMDTLDISRMTVRSALSKLESEHYITKLHGKGAFVCYVEKPTAGSIEVLLDVKDAYFSPYYIQQISEVLEKHNYKFNIHDTRDSLSEITRLLSRIVDSEPSGIIIEPSHSPDSDDADFKNVLLKVRQKSIPYIFIDHDIEGVPGNRMIVDDYYGGRRAALYLLKLGHKKIAFQLKPGFTEYQNRLDGLNSALHDKHMDPAAVFTLNESSDTHLKNIICRNHITAIFCSNDEGALELMHILQKNGIKIPEEISIIGYDDTILATATNPKLTSVSHPKGLLGKMAAEALITYCTDHKPISDELVKPDIHERDSCRKLM